MLPTAQLVNLKPSNIAPLLVKMAQNLDLRCVLVPAPRVLGGQNTSRIRNEEIYAILYLQASLIPAYDTNTMPL